MSVRHFICLGALVLGPATALSANVEIRGEARDIGVTSQGEGNAAVISIGGIDGDDVGGVGVINGRVFIDGEEIPPTATRHRSRSGTVYLVRRSASGVQVIDEAAATRESR